ncbi:MAG: hypothetical protein V4488_26680 [Pseudomonadota bacterium]
MPLEPKAIFIAKDHLFYQLFQATGCTVVAIYFIKMFVDVGDKLSEAPVVFIPLLFATIAIVVLGLLYWRSGLRRVPWLLKRIPLMQIEASGFSCVVDFGETRFTKYKEIASLEVEKRRTPRGETQITMTVTKISGDVEKIFLNDLAINPDELLIDLKSRM